VDTYGVPRYREANPALFTAATFPFFFGIMYGDMGHGFVLFLFALFLVVTEHRAEARSTSDALKVGRVVLLTFCLVDHIAMLDQGFRRIHAENASSLFFVVLWQSMYPARYMLLLMGIFAMYSGLIYNEWFCLPINLFGSKYDYLEKEDGEAEFVAKYPYGSYESVYPMGMDPAWRVSSNSLLFVNSMKMKLSVVLGIIHMTWGIILRGANAVYFKQSLDFVMEFLPMIIFDLALFGYMVVLIFVKWSINWEERMLSATCFLDGDPTTECTTIAASQGLCKVYNSNIPCYPGTSTTADLCPLDYGGTG